MFHQLCRTSDAAASRPHSKTHLSVCPLVRKAISCKSLGGENLILYLNLKSVKSTDTISASPSFQQQLLMISGDFDGFTLVQRHFANRGFPIMLLVEDLQEGI